MAMRAYQDMERQRTATHPREALREAALPLQQVFKAWGNSPRSASTCRTWRVTLEIRYQPGTDPERY